MALSRARECMCPGCLLRQAAKLDGSVIFIKSQDANKYSDVIFSRHGDPYVLLENDGEGGLLLSEFAVPEPYPIPMVIGSTNTPCFSRQGADPLARHRPGVQGPVVHQHLG